MPAVRMEGSTLVLNYAKLLKSKAAKTNEVVRGIEIPEHLQHLPKHKLVALLYLFGKVV